MRGAKRQMGSIINTLQEGETRQQFLAKNTINENYCGRGPMHFTIPKVKNECSQAVGYPTRDGTDRGKLDGGCRWMEWLV